MRVVLWVLLLAALPSIPSAPPPAAQVQRSRPEVQIVLVGGAQARDAAHEVLQELLEELEVDVLRRDVDHVEAAALIDRGPSEPRLATVLVDLRGDPAWVYVIDQGFERVLARSVQLEAGFDEIAREQVGAIVAEAVDALEHGSTIGMHADAFLGRAEPTPAEPTPAEPTPAEPSPPPVAGPAPPPPAPASPPGPTQWSLELAYRVGARGSAPPDHALAIGGLLERGLKRPASLRLGAHLEGWLPAQVGSASSVVMSGLMPSATVGLGLQPGRIGVVAELGVGLAVVRASAAVSPQPVWHPVPLLQARTALVVGLPAGLYTGLGARVLLDPVDVRILDQARGRVLFDPLRVWPAVEVMLGWRPSIGRTNVTAQ